jgi:hypothetical protein
LDKKLVESPDSAQPKPPHEGSCNSVPLMSWPVARKVSAPVGEAVTPGEAAVLPGDEAGTLGVAAELAGAAVVLEAGDAAGLVASAPCGVGPLHAVNSKARQASDAQAATCRGLAPFVVLMMSNPFNLVQRRGELYHIYDAGRPAAVETRWRRAATTIRSA